MLSFFRILKFAFQDIGRNMSLSFMTVFILVLMLLSVNVLWSLDVITKESVNSVKKQVDVSFYFSTKALEKDIKDIQDFVKSFPEVTEVKIISSDQVLKEFKERHDDQKETMEALNELGENPFGNTMVVKTNEPKDYNKIITALDVPEYQKIIESRSFDEHGKAIERLQDITSRIEKVGFGLTALFAIIAFLIIFNTVRSAINTQWIEISIKRLVGASNWFIRGPYLVESLLFTIISMIFTIVVVFFALGWLDPYLSAVLPDGFALTNYYKSNIFLLFGVQFIAVLFLTIFSSGLAMRRQLKV
ncbi:MAG: permease-like cell division protein FtsX [bacterium]